MNEYEREAAEALEHARTAAYKLTAMFHIARAIVAGLNNIAAAVRKLEKALP